MSLLHQKLQLKDFGVRNVALEKITFCLIVAADDLLAGCLLAHLVVADTVSGHVDTHISW